MQMRVCNCPIIPAVQMPHKGQGGSGPPRLQISPLNQSKLPKYTSGVEKKSKLTTSVVYIIWKVYFLNAIVLVFLLIHSQDLRMLFNERSVKNDYWVIAKIAVKCQVLITLLQVTSGWR